MKQISATLVSVAAAFGLAFAGVGAASADDVDHPQDWPKNQPAFGRWVFDVPDTPGSEVGVPRLNLTTAQTDLLLQAMHSVPPGTFIPLPFGLVGINPHETAQEAYEVDATDGNACASFYIMPGENPYYPGSTQSLWIAYWTPDSCN